MRTWQIAVTAHGLLTLSRLALPSAQLTATVSGLSGSGSRLAFEAVTVPEHPDWGALTGTATRSGNVGWVFNPPESLVEEFISVSTVHFTTTGPCQVSGRCVGRPSYYRDNENCAITVAGAGFGRGPCPGRGPCRRLGPCPVFNTESSFDIVTIMPDGNEHGGTDCPVGVMLLAGQTLSWHSDSSVQASGWQICFA